MKKIRIIFWIIITFSIAFIFTLQSSLSNTPPVCSANCTEFCGKYSSSSPAAAKYLECISDQIERGCCVKAQEVTTVAATMKNETESVESSFKTVTSTIVAVIIVVVVVVEVIICTRIFYAIYHKRAMKRQERLRFIENAGGEVGSALSSSSSPLSI